jgi:hypothetical protein
MQYSIQARGIGIICNINQTIVIAFRSNCERKNSGAGISDNKTHIAAAFSTFNLMDYAELWMSYNNKRPALLALNFHVISSFCVSSSTYPQRSTQWQRLAFAAFRASFQCGYFH